MTDDDLSMTLEDMAYSEDFSVSVNMIGTIDCDSVKGCEGNCYAGDCYALRTAQRYGWDFHDWKIRRFSEDEREKFIRQIQAAQKQSKGREWARIGVMGDPSLSWSNTVRVAGLIKDAGLVPIVISKHRRIATDEQFKKLIEHGAVLHSSICTLDGPAIKGRYEQAIRYKKLGGKSLIRLITYEAGLDADKKMMKWFIDNSAVPILETPMRMTKNNKFVTSGRVLNPNRTIEMTKRVCAAIPPNDCYSCKEQCGVDWNFKDSVDDMWEAILPLFRELSLSNSDTYPDGETVIGTDLKWTTEYINSLPDTSFAVIEPDYLNGKTENKNARHLPYKNKEGEIDLPHLRNAMARLNQVKPITSSITAEELRAKAKSVLEPLAAKHLESSREEKDYIMPDSLSAGVTMPEFTAETLVRDFGVPTDKAEDLMKLLDAIKTTTPTARKPITPTVKPISPTQPMGGGELVGGSSLGYFRTIRGKPGGAQTHPYGTKVTTISIPAMEPRYYPELGLTYSGNQAMKMDVPFSEEELKMAGRWAIKLANYDRYFYETGGAGDLPEPEPTNEEERKERDWWDNVKDWWVMLSEPIWAPWIWITSFAAAAPVGVIYLYPRFYYFWLKKAEPGRMEQFKDYAEYRKWYLEQQKKIPPKPPGPSSGVEVGQPQPAYSPQGVQGSSPWDRMLPAEGSGQIYAGSPIITNLGWYNPAMTSTLAPYQGAPGTAGVPGYGVPGYGGLSANVGGGWGYGSPVRTPHGWGASADCPTINDVAEFIKKNDELVGGSSQSQFKSMRGLGGSSMRSKRPQRTHHPVNLGGVAPGIEGPPGTQIAPIPNVIALPAAIPDISIPAAELYSNRVIGLPAHLQPYGADFAARQVNLQFFGNKPQFAEGARFDTMKSQNVSNFLRQNGYEYVGARDGNFVFKPITPTGPPATGGVASVPSGSGGAEIRPREPSDPFG